MEREGEKMIVSVCIGSTCHLKGSRQVVEQLDNLVKENNLSNDVVLNGSFCMGECVNGVCVKVEDKLFSVTPEDTGRFFHEEIYKKIIG
jgi:NADH:ubiquinone oxidoreductase subunit E